MKSAQRTVANQLVMQVFNGFCGMLLYPMGASLSTFLAFTHLAKGAVLPMITGFSFPAWSAYETFNDVRKW